MLALCKCGIDMTEHKYGDWDDEVPDILPGGEHMFDASGTKYRCEEIVTLSMLDMTGNIVTLQWTCPRPAYHKQEGVECGPLTGKKLWE